MIGKLKVRFEEYLNQNKLRETPESLFEPINYIMATGGKRFRPLLCLILSCNEGKQPGAEALQCALTIELFHNFTLVHDDIMDGADMRRGVPSVHKKYSIPKAILSGDAMLILCFDMLTQIENQHKDLLLREFIQSALDVCKGQELDMEFEKREDVEYGEYIEMVRLKTGALIGLSLYTGAILGGLSLENARIMKEAGEQVGVAFQAKDDYLDIYGISAETGKKRGGDILNGKKTLLYYYAMKDAEAYEKAMLEGVFDKKVKGDDEVVEKVKAIYDKYDVRSSVENDIAIFQQQAKKMINSIPLSEEVREELDILFPMLTERNL